MEILDLAIDPVNPMILYAGTRNGVYGYGAVPSAK
jgi:hypothetical protein